MTVDVTDARLLARVEELVSLADEHGIGRVRFVLAERYGEENRELIDQLVAAVYAKQLADREEAMRLVKRRLRRRRLRVRRPRRKG